MSKDKLKLYHFDFDTGILALIPTSHETYKKCNNCSEYLLKKGQGELKDKFKDIFLKALIPKIEPLKQFPTKNEVFIFIVQYFSSMKDYASQDLDNMAKTILDLFKGQFYINDSQVRVLLMLKKLVDNQIPQDYAYIAVKELKDNRDSDIVKAAGIERSVTYYHELVKSS